MGTLLFFYRCQSPAPLDRRGTTQMSFFRFFTKRRRHIFCLEDQKWREHSARSCLCIRHRICRVGRCPDGKGWLRRFHGGRACIPSFTFSQPIFPFIAFVLYIGLTLTILRIHFILVTGESRISRLSGEVHTVSVTSDIHGPRRALWPPCTQEVPWRSTVFGAVPAARVCTLPLKAERTQNERLCRYYL